MYYLTVRKTIFCWKATGSSMHKYINCIRRRLTYAFFSSSQSGAKLYFGFKIFEELIDEEWSYQFFKNIVGLCDDLHG